MSRFVFTITPRVAVATLVMMASLVGARVLRAAPDLVSVEASGSALAGDEARTQALDLAFSEAVDKVVVQLVTSDARRAHRDAIRANVLRRARRFVASFRVKSSESREGRVHVQIVAKVRSAMVRDALTKLGVSSPDTAAVVVSPVSSARPPVALIALTRRPGGTDATFGSAASAGGPAGKELATRLDDLGFTRVSLAGKSVPTATSAPSGVPLADAAAVALAKSAGAGIAVVCGVSLTPQGRVRGTNDVGAAAELHLRVIDAGTGAVVMRTRVHVGGHGAALAKAMANAARDAAQRAMRQVASSMKSRWPAAQTERAAALVTVQGVVVWSSVEALIRSVRATPGVSSAGVRRMQTGGVLVAVEGKLSPAQLVSVLRAASVPVGTATVSGPEGNVIKVTLANQQPAVTP